MPHHDDFPLKLRCGSQKAIFWHYAFSCSEIAGVFHTMHSEATIIRSSESRQHQINQNFQYGLVKSVVLPDSPEAAENQVNLLLKVLMHFSLIFWMSCLIKEILRIERNKYEIQSLSYNNDCLFANEPFVRIGGQHLAFNRENRRVRLHLGLTCSWSFSETSALRNSVMPQCKIIFDRYKQCSSKNKSDTRTNPGDGMGDV